MKITDTTPKLERTFTVELTEIELQTLKLSVGESRHCDVEATAKVKRVEVLTHTEAHWLYQQLGDALKGVKK